MARGKFKISQITSLLGYRISQKEVAKIVAGLKIEPSDNFAAVSSSIANVAVAQVVCKHYNSLSDFIVDMNQYVADAVDKRAHVVCFPAFTGLLPLTFLSQFKNMLPFLQVRGNDIPDPKKIEQCLKATSDTVFDAFYYTMSALAASHKIYIMAGSIVYYDADEPRHSALLFDSSGELVGTQDKIAPSSLEHALKIKTASEIMVFPTSFGNLSILIGSDASYFEIAKAAKSNGANILLSPAAIPGVYTPMDSAGGLNLRVQENSVYGVQCTMVGGTKLGAVLEAPCIFYAPHEVLRSKVKNGIFAQTNGRNEPEVLCARLDLDILLNIRNPYKHDKNPELLSKYIDKLF